MEITFIQTSDPFRYSKLLDITSRTVKAYCQKFEFRYESFVGIKRGFWPWQASFNRIYMLEELVDRGHAGWVFYLDADAYIVDLEFDLISFLDTMSDKAFVATTSGASSHLWDINNGVFMINLARLEALKILREWKWIYETADDEMLKRCTDFNMGLDDQSMLHQVLSQTPQLERILGQTPWELMNSSEATFVRQQLRVMSSSFEERVTAVQSAVNEVIAGEHMRLRRS